MQDPDSGGQVSRRHDSAGHWGLGKQVGCGHCVRRRPNLVQPKENVSTEHTPTTYWGNNQCPEDDFVLHHSFIPPPGEGFQPTQTATHHKVTNLEVVNFILEFQVAEWPGEHLRFGRHCLCAPLMFITFSVKIEDIDVRMARYVCTKLFAAFGNLPYRLKEKWRLCNWSQGFDETICNLAFAAIDMNNYLSSVWVMSIRIRLQGWWPVSISAENWWKGVDCAQFVDCMIRSTF